MLGAPLFFSTTSRLLVELNRSPHHRGLFSAITKPLPAAERADILARYYVPYREEVERWIAGETRRGTPVLHLSIHSFTPSLNGEVRTCELGLLYDPRRRSERRYAGALHAALAPGAAAAGYRIRRNYPYTGRSDGFMTHLRRTFPDRLYAGFEIEMNQAVVGTPSGRMRMAALLAGLG
jgi:predicted N-formylglutamate amidohydrolase